MGMSRMKVRIGIAALLALAAPAVRAAPRPVLDRDFPDPFVWPTRGGLVAYATNSAPRGRLLHVQMSTSRDGRHWSAPVDAMPAAPRWARRGTPDIWAPEVARVGNRFLLYFSARHATRTRPDGLTLCVGVAVARRATGPFIAQSQPLTCGGAHGVIDASPFEAEGTRWLYVKTDGNCCHTQTTIVAQRLTMDGLHLAGAPVTVQGVTDAASPPGRVIEGPEMRRHDGRYTLFYARGAYDRADYALGTAHCDTPTGPCHAAPEPILATRPGLFGPGHGCVFAWRGRSWLAVAAWRPRPLPHRAMYLFPLDWARGRPVVRAR